MSILSHIAVAMLSSAATLTAVRLSQKPIKRQTDPLLQELEDQGFVPDEEEEPDGGYWRLNLPGDAFIVVNSSEFGEALSSKSKRFSVTKFSGEDENSPDHMDDCTEADSPEKLLDEVNRMVKEHLWPEDKEQVT